jgi:hypothetical protein
MKNVQLNTHQFFSETSKEFWDAMLSFFLQSGLRYNSSFEKYVDQAQLFIHNQNLVNSKVDPLLLSVNSVIDEELFEYKNYKDAEKFDFELGFDNFFVTLKDKLDDSDDLQESELFEGSQRQAVPPMRADEPVGHNGDIKEHQSNYSYLFDRV